LTALVTGLLDCKFMKWSWGIFQLLRFFIEIFWIEYYFYINVILDCPLNPLNINMIPVIPLIITGQIPYEWNGYKNDFKSSFLPYLSNMGIKNEWCTNDVQVENFNITRSFAFPLHHVNLHTTWIGIPLSTKYSFDLAVFWCHIQFHPNQGCHKVELNWSSTVSPLNVVDLKYREWGFQFFTDVFFDSPLNP